MRKTTFKPDMYERRTILLGGTIMHSARETYYIENILHHHKFERVVEFGTSHGRLSLLFGIYALSHGNCITFDITIEPNNHIWKALKPVLPLEFYQMDVFSPEAQAIVADFVKDHKTLIYCDNGKKIDEFNMYAHLLKPGDFIMAHDRHSEVKYKDIEDTVEACNLEIMYEEFVKILKVRQFCFRKRGE